MKLAFSHLLIMLIATASAFAQDTVIFKNGDVLTGTILKQDAERVYFTTGTFGEVSLNASDIEEIRTEAPKLVEETVSAEPLTTPAPVVQPTPDPPVASVVAPAAQVAPKKKRQWTGQAGMAIAMREKTSTNASGISGEEQYETYRIYGDLNWTGEKNGLKWNWTYRYSEDETKKRDDYFNVTQKYNHNLKGGYYAEAKSVYQRDYNRRIDKEYLQTVEIGKKWFQKPKFQLSTSIGAGYHQYERDEITTSQPKFIFDETLRWQMINSLTLFQKYTHLGDLEKYHFIFTSGLENKLIRDVFLRLEYRLDRDTDTSYDDRGYYDKALLTSLLYKF